MQRHDYILEDETMQMTVVNFTAQGRLTYFHSCHFVLLTDNLATQTEGIFQVVICFSHFLLIYCYFGNCLIWPWKEQWVLLHSLANLLCFMKLCDYGQWIADGTVLHFQVWHSKSPKIATVPNHLTARCRRSSAKAWQSIRWKGHGFLNHHMESGCQLNWIRNKWISVRHKHFHFKVENLGMSVLALAFSDTMKIRDLLFWMIKVQISNIVYHLLDKCTKRSFWVSTSAK